MTTKTLQKKKTPKKATAKKAAEKADAYVWAASTSDLSDVRPSVLGLYRTEDEAKAAVRADMDLWRKRNVLDEEDEEDLTFDADEMVAEVTGRGGRVWNVEKVPGDFWKEPARSRR